MPRPRRLIIDAFNVLHVTGALDPQYAGPGLADLADLIATSRWGQIRSSLICDGPGVNARMKPPGNVEIIYAGAGKDADSLIESIVRASSAPRFLSVVSSDRRIQKAAKKRRAEVISSDAFLQRLNLDANRQSSSKPSPPRHLKPDGPIPSPEVKKWLSQFGISDSDPIRKAKSSGKAPPKSGEPARNEPGPPLPIDPEIEAALQEWRGQLSLDDLDMRRWIEGVQPLDDD
jgi:uncharacterized protein